MNLKTQTNFVIVVFALLVAGCGSLSKPYPEKTLHAIHIGDPAADPSAPTTSPSKLVLRVDRVTIAEPFDATTFIYQVGDSTYKSDYYNGFVAPPSRLLANEIGTFLSKSGLFATVFSGESTADYQLSLEANVPCLCGDYRDASNPKAEIVARFFLIDQTHGRYAVIFDKTYSQSTPINGKDPDALVKAWESGWTQILTQLTSDLRGDPVVMATKSGS
jgi:uncharacterized lipoprotein YmbA